MAMALYDIINVINGLRWVSSGITGEIEDTQHVYRWTRYIQISTRRSDNLLQYLRSN